MIRLAVGVRARIFLVLALAALTPNCTTSPYTGRTQLTAPEPVSVVYSELNMQLALVTAQIKPAASDATDAFEQRVARVGAQLAEQAFSQFPGLHQRFERFEFIIADKAELGTVSNAAGRVAILRPVAALAPTDAALAFVLAREMGHVIGDHHGENTGAGLVISGLALILLPVTGIASAIGSLFAPAGTAAAASSTTGTATAAANAATSAVSFVGSKLIVRTYRESQVEEADMLALQLLRPLCYTPSVIAAAFGDAKFPQDASDWTSTLQESITKLKPTRRRADHVQIGRDDPGGCTKPGNL